MASGSARPNWTSSRTFRTCSLLIKSGNQDEYGVEEQDGLGSTASCSVYGGSHKSLSHGHKYGGLSLRQVPLGIADNALRIVDTCLKSGGLAKFSGVSLELAHRTLNMGRPPQLQSIPDGAIRLTTITSF